MNESDVSAKVRIALGKQGAVCWKVSDRFHASRPDLVACYKGQFIAIEMKIYPNDPTLAQDFELKLLAGAGAWAYCVWYSKRTKIYFAKQYPDGQIATFESLEGLTEWLLHFSNTNKSS